MRYYEKPRLVDYVVDGGDGEEELFNTKREAIKRARELSKEKGEPIRIQRWHRPYGLDSDMEIDEGFDLVVRNITIN